MKDDLTKKRNSQNNRDDEEDHLLGGVKDFVSTSDNVIEEKHKIASRGPSSRSQALEVRREKDNIKASSDIKLSLLDKRLRNRKKGKTSMSDPSPIVMKAANDGAIALKSPLSEKGKSIEIMDENTHDALEGADLLSAEVGSSRLSTSSANVEREDQPANMATIENGRSQQTPGDGSINHCHVAPGAVAIPGFRPARDDVSLESSTSANSSRERQAEELLVTAELVDGEEFNQEERDRIYQQGQVEAEDRIRRQTVNAEIIDEEAKQRQQSRRRILWTSASLLIVLAVAVGAGVGVSRRRSSPDAVLIGDTLSPTVSTAPSMAPSSAPSTFPSTAPTSAPDNDFCQDAVALSSTTSVVSPVLLSTNGTSDVVPSCSATPGSNAEAVVTSAPGRWFSFLGRGAASTSFTLCMPSGYDDFGEVYVFSGGCESLSCISNTSGASYLVKNTDCSAWSEGSWDAADGVLYHILVTGSTDFNLSISDNESCEDAIGPLKLDGSPVFGSSASTAGAWYFVDGSGGFFTARLDCGAGSTVEKMFIYTGSCGSLASFQSETIPCDLESAIRWESQANALYYIHVAISVASSGPFTLSIDTTIANDRCEDAIGPLAINASGVVGTTTNATADNVERCGDVPNSGSGVWYTIFGTGEEVSVFTCDPGTNFDTRLSIFQGTCGALQCIQGNDDACGKQSTVTWFSEPDVMYYILVHGAGSSAGDFVISADKISKTCQDALPLNVDGSLTVRSNADSTHEVGGRCRPGESSGRDLQYSTGGFGLWYSIVGTGRGLQLSTCDQITDIETAVSVYSGTCGSLLCVSSSEFCSVPWLSTEDELYYVVVHGISGELGTIGVRVEEFIPPENDSCPGAVGPLGTSDSTTLGSTSNATTDKSPCGGTVVSGTWYLVTGSGSALKATVIGDFFVKLQVFTGVCNALACVSTSPWYQSPSSVTWLSTNAAVYYILVGHSDVSGGGDFDLLVETFTPISNDNCEASFGPLPLNSSSLTGSTGYATQEDVDNCDFLPEAFVGVWYYLTGTGNVISVSFGWELQDSQGNLMDLDERAHVIASLFTGSCEVLNCLSFLDTSSYGATPEISGETNPGLSYYLLVQTPFSFGNFALTAQEVFPPPNDKCQDALPLRLGTIMIGSNAGAKEDLNELGAGVWYRHNVVEAGRGLRITTSPPTSFDACLVVFTGSCESLQTHVFARYCGPESSVSWNQLTNEAYWILLHASSHDTTTGEFALSVEEFELAPNDECAKAKGPLEIGGPALNDSTANATRNFNGFPPGVWFSVVGNGAHLKASIDFKDSWTFVGGFQRRLALYRGACEELRYSTQSSEVSGFVNWLSIEGEIYHLWVYGALYELEGKPIQDFQLTVTEIEKPAVNDRCSEASGPLQVDGSVSLSFTKDATIDTDAPVCGTDDFVSERGIWYFVTGTGGELLATTCVVGIYTSLACISVFQGDCNSLICVASETVDSCAFPVTWKSAIGVIYSILVFLDTTEDARVGISVSETPEEVANDRCEDALVLPVDGTSSTWSNVNATVETATGCTEQPSIGRAVWYKVVGNGKQVRASTCGLKVLDTQMTIFTGDCSSSLRCLTYNDDDWTCGTQSTASWSSISGVTYYIAVSGFYDEDEGSFTLTVDEDEE